MQIDERAPLAGKKEIIIDAPIDHVWKIQSDIENWPAWQKDITSAKLDGELKKGTVFRWKAMGMGITSVLQEVEKNKVISWTGDSLGTHAVHRWLFERQGGKTKVTTEESLSGWFAAIMRFFKPDFMEESLTKALETLQQHAEKTK